jgi:predicted Zn-dependent protease with MMP-like domain
MLDDKLETGWSKLEAGDVAGARAAADQALALDAKSAEAHTLDGAVAAATDERERALAAFRRAMKLDAEAFEPAILAAELLAGEDDLEVALRAAGDALDRADEEEDFLDALLLKAELELALEDGDAAVQTLAEVPPADVELPDASYHVRVAGCLLDADELDGAAAHAEAAARREPESADAHHLVGLVAEARGDDAGRLRAFQRVWELDRRAPAPPWTVPAARMEELARAALDELPARAQELLGNVPIVIEDYPPRALVDDGVDPRVLGLFSGVPYPEQSAIGGPTGHLECVQLFQRNIEREARTAEDAEREIRITVLHETAQFFGLDEDALEALGLD